jgi:hypothetical protein
MLTHTACTQTSQFSHWTMLGVLSWYTLSQTGHTLPRRRSFMHPSHVV